VVLLKVDAFRRILIAVDDSEISDKAFQSACLLARNSDMPIQIVHVVEEPVSVGYSISKELERTGKEILEKYEARAKSFGLRSVKTLQVRGYPTEEILKIADRENVDTIIVGGRGRYASKDFLLGSTSYKLAHYSKCTVIIVK
jgi:nucleotide-binding universal stress UspA family protein